MCEECVVVWHLLHMAPESTSLRKFYPIFMVMCPVICVYTLSVPNAPTTYVCDKHTINRIDGRTAQMTTIQTWKYFFIREKFYS